MPKFILDEAVINAIVKDPGNEKAQRAYAYYYKKYRDFYDNEPILKELPEWESDDVQNERQAKRKQSNDYGQMSLFDFLDDDKDDGDDDE